MSNLSTENEKPAWHIADVIGRFFYAWNINYSGRRFGFVIIPFFPRALLGFKFRRFDEGRKSRPLKNKGRLTICFLYINLNFRLGIQKRTWFYIHCEELRNLKFRIKNGNEPPF